MSDKDPDSEAEQTLIRQMPNDDKTRIRDNSEASDSGAERDAELISEPPKVNNPISDDKTHINPSASSAEKPPSNAATILRQPEDKKTQDAAPAAATILRAPGDAPIGGATILAEGATILGRDSYGDDDATVMPMSDDGSTVINSMGDDDSTIIGGAGAGKMDTTYIADIGDSAKSRGNTEAGRLLKNRFVLEERIGSGGMGDVYKALDLRQQEAKERNPYIAIKILNETFARHKDAFISLQREATRTRGIPHPNIMGVYDFDREGDTVFMSMELLDGKPLDDYLKDHPEGVSIEDSWNIIDGICQGLARAHGAGIVHSDFKPGNIYYCVDKTAKVFDFGIARAVPVNDGEELEAEGDATVFDAGSLGALTPTYASLEMLTGKTPTKSDDVYAVALVAYELFTGKHPYNRTPANKALDQGLEPEPIPFLKRRHWKALKKALALKGEDRTKTIDEFQEGMFSEDPPYFRYAAIAAVLSLSVGYGVYQQFKAAEVLPEGFTDLVQVFNASESDINNRMNVPDFASEAFRDALPVALNRMMLMNGNAHEPEWAEYVEEDWDLKDSKSPARKIDDSRIKIVEGYLKKIVEDRINITTNYLSLSNIEVVEEAIRILTATKTYTEEVKEDFYFGNLGSADEESDPLIGKKRDLNSTIETETKQILAFLVQREEAKVAIELENIRLDEEQKQQAYLAEVRRRETDKRNQFRTQYSNARSEFADILLSCKGHLDDKTLADGAIYRPLPRLGELISEMKDSHPKQFSVDKPGFVAALAGCIGDRIAIVDPDDAENVKSVVMTYLPNEPDLEGIIISPIDPCSKRSLVGQGDHGRNWCSDDLVIAEASGPQLVVVPPRFGENELKKFAISRMEIKVSEFNLFCKTTGCQQITGEASNPATNISVDQANNYVAWLSKEGFGSYRLPTKEEWLYAVISTAVTADNVELDTNINCTVDSRGVRLGDKLVNTQSGKPNKWGLYNFVGNAREWVVQKGDDGETLLALGGAHTDPRSKCVVTAQVAHSGERDMVTGFRVVRQIIDRKNST